MLVMSLVGAFFGRSLAWCGHEMAASGGGLRRETSAGAACDVSGEAKRFVLKHLLGTCTPSVATCTPPLHKGHSASCLQM
jgi:hypothetical protein